MGCHKNDRGLRRQGKASITSLKLNFLTGEMSGNKDIDYLAGFFSSSGEVRNVKMFGKLWKM